MAAAEFVTDNLDQQIKSFNEVVSKMRASLDELTDEEREDIERASILLRRERAMQASRSLPIVEVWNGPRPTEETE